MINKNLILMTGLLGGMSAFAAEISIQCYPGSGTAELITERGGSIYRVDASKKSVDVRLRARDTFIWGHATGGGWTGEHIEPGAEITLTHKNEIRLRQGSEFYGEKVSDEIVPNGTYKFSTYNGHSLTCQLRVLG